MPESASDHRIFIEVGKKKAFAGSLDWPGWCRSGRDEDAALKALINYGARYAGILRSTALGFEAPTNPASFTVIERQDGNRTTDFGAPAIILDADQEPIDQKLFDRSRTILQACWSAFDKAVQSTKGRELRKGPRGGGRDAEKILEHVMAGDQGYLSRLAWKHKVQTTADPVEELNRTREAIISALQVALDGDLPERGPRGGIIWPPRFFIRRVAWHVLDHAWEIEDRIV